MLLPHAKELIGFLPLAELYTEFAEHERLSVFAAKGRVCVACGREGTFLALGMEKREQHKVHIDLYTDDFVLMTVDHIVPKAVCKRQGWSKQETEALSNKQPMCDPCNNSKGHKVLTVQEMRERRHNTNKPIEGAEIVRELISNIHALLGDAYEVTI